MLNPHFVILGAILSFLGTLNYAVNTIKGKTKPNRVTWFMWALAPMIAFSAELKSGVGLESLLAFSAGFNPLVIFIASFVNKKSVWRITRFDLVCGALSLLGLCLWLVTRRGDIAIVFSIAADGLAGVPTLIKSYKHPETESWIGYALSGVSAVIALFTIKHWTFASYAFSIYFLILCIIFTALIRFEFGTRLSARLKAT